MKSKRILWAVLLAAALVAAAYGALQFLLIDQCDLGFTPAECAQLG